MHLIVILPARLSSHAVVYVMNSRKGGFIIYYYYKLLAYFHGNPLIDEAPAVTCDVYRIGARVMDRDRSMIRILLLLSKYVKLLSP